MLSQICSLDTKQCFLVLRAIPVEWDEGIASRAFRFGRPLVSGVVPFFLSGEGTMKIKNIPSAQKDAVLPD